MKSPAKRPESPQDSRAAEPSRRRLMAGMAALAATAASLPTVAANTMPSGDLPDAELIELGSEYQLLDGAIKAVDAVADAYREQEPEPPDALRHRIVDHAILGLPILDTCRRGLSCDVENNDLYSEAEIESLPLTPKARPWNLQNQQARIAEIESTWDRWNEECGALNEALGVDEAMEEMEALVPRQRQLAKRIAAMPAATPAGLRVRALILAAMLDEEEDEDDYTDQLMIRAIVRDLVKMKV